MTELKKYYDGKEGEKYDEMSNYEVGEEVANRAEKYAKENNVPYLEASDAVLDADPDLKRRYTSGQSSKEQKKAYSRKLDTREKRENADKEITRLTSLMSLETGRGYTECMRIVLTENEQLRRDYLGA